MKKIIALGLFFTIIMGMLMTGCASKGNEVDSELTAESSTSEKSSTSSTSAVKLTIWIPGSGDATYDEAWNTILKAYQDENQGFQYELTLIPWGEYFTKLNAAFSGGVGPDLFGVGYGQLGTLQNNGNLLDMNPYILEDWDGWTDISENIIAQGQKEEGTYGFLMPDIRTLLYRTDIAKQNDVTEDDLRFSTVEELCALAEKMTVRDENGNVEVAGLELRTATAQSCEQNFYIFSSWFGAGDMWNSDLRANFTNEGNVEALESMRSLLDSGAAVLNETGDSVSQFQNGIAAMTLNIESILAAAKLAYPDSVAAIAFDMDTLTLGTFYSVNAATKYPEEASDLMSYIFGQESQKVFAEVMGQTPSRSSLSDWFIQRDASGDNAEIMKMYEHAKNYSSSLNYEFLNLMSLLRVSIEDVFYNNTDPQKALEECAEEYNALFN